MKTQSNSEQPIGDIIILLVIGAGLAVVSANWLVGNLAALLARRQPLDASLVEAWMALRRMPDHWGDPRQAWAEPAASKLPGPILYWASAAVVIAVLLCVGVVVLMRMNRRHEPIDQRRRVGVETQARLARSRDMRPLLSAQPQVGRFVLARWGHRRWLSTEADVYKSQRGVRGAVGVFGPSQSGKTTGLIAGVEAWTGPAIVSSVKTDLMRATLARRSDAGEVKVFDPGGDHRDDHGNLEPAARGEDSGRGDGGRSDAGPQRRPRREPVPVLAGPGRTAPGRHVVDGGQHQGPLDAQRREVGP